MPGMKMKAAPIFLLVVALVGCIRFRIHDSRAFSSAGKNSSVSESLSTNDTMHFKAKDLEYADSSGHVPIQKPAELWLWCQLDKDNISFRKFQHLPHASQALLPCWSWFQEIMQARSQQLTAAATSAHTHCGFYLKDGLGRFVRPERWIDALIRHMGCSVTEIEPSQSVNTSICVRNGTWNCEARDTNLVHRLPKKDYYSLQYFQRPIHAAALRKKILRSLNFKDKHRSSTAHIAIVDGKHIRHRRFTARIAIVDRKHSRRIMNLKNMVAAVREAFPNAIVETAYMEDMKPTEQFLFWSQHDIIITGHGAAITNAFFLPPGNASAVVEIFPPHYYYVNFFSSLLKSAGLHGYGYFNGVSDYITDHKEHSKTLKERSFWRGQNLTPPVDAIVDLVRQAMFEGGFQ